MRYVGTSPLAEQWMGVGVQQRSCLKDVLMASDSYRRVTVGVHSQLADGASSFARHPCLNSGVASADSSGSVWWLKASVLQEPHEVSEPSAWEVEVEKPGQCQSCRSGERAGREASGAEPFTQWRMSAS